MRPELRHKMYQDVSSKNALINKYLKKIAEQAEIEKPLSMHISRHSFAHIAQESGAESSAIKNILGHSNLATTERYMGSFDTSKTDETLRNVFAKKQSTMNQEEMSTESKEELAVELLKGMTPAQIMAVISEINK
ncbi:tyrosine-type recombinase/integrase [uncultured Duncaniella sp.]|uniref:tyrosine-type recombinase/integrase n=1 Tax=uncultured Duncaniella sp. TaxID=2768039 RepID=UPI002639037D|nr:tyrosine-type recombinase/integrase [uncultured Duncaniella sp.]